MLKFVIITKYSSGNYLHEGNACKIREKWKIEKFCRTP